ncbi:MAG: DOMON domain-containing protein [Spirochaetota bacterium]
MIMHTKRIVFVISIVVVLVASPLAASGNKEAEVTVREGLKSITAEDMTVSWEIMEDSVRFELEAPTTGWLAIGFDPARIMKDAQFIIAYVKDGEVAIRDDFGTGTFNHTPDEALGGSDDITNAEGSEQDGKTAVSFVIPLDTGDKYDAPLVPGEKHTLLIAYGNDGFDDFSSNHQNRASIEITL